MGARGFVFLELLDPEVNSLLWGIREILGASAKARPIHLTIRGPYDGAVPESALGDCRQKLKGDVVRLHGIGRFRNPGEEVVYLRVDSPNLREVWWKPDFPIERYGFEPHVSLYRGRDGVLADLAMSFLAARRIELLCAEHGVVARESQMDLFTNASRRTTDLTRLSSSGTVDPGLLVDLRGLVADYRAGRFAPTRELPVVRS